MCYDVIGRWQESGAVTNEHHPKIHSLSSLVLMLNIFWSCNKFEQLIPNSWGTTYRHKGNNVCRIKYTYMEKWKTQDPMVVMSSIYYHLSLLLSPFIEDPLKSVTKTLYLYLYMYRIRKKLSQI